MHTCKTHTLDFSYPQGAYKETSKYLKQLKKENFTFLEFNKEIQNSFESCTNEHPRLGWKMLKLFPPSLEKIIALFKVAVASEKVSEHETAIKALNQVCLDSQISPGLQRNENFLPDYEKSFESQFSIKLIAKLYSKFKREATTEPSQQNYIIFLIEIARILKESYGQEVMDVFISKVKNPSEKTYNEIFTEILVVLFKKIEGTSFIDEEYIKKTMSNPLTQRNLLICLFYVSKDIPKVLPEFNI